MLSLAERLTLESACDGKSLIYDTNSNGLMTVP